MNLIEEVEGKLDSVEYRVMGRKTTICLLTTVNGFEVVGVAHCLDLKRFDVEVGKQTAYDDAIKKLAAHEAYFLTTS